jgi:hypothetical protein
MYELDLSVYFKTCEGKVDVSLGLRPESDTMTLLRLEMKMLRNGVRGCNYDQRRVSS